MISINIFISHSWAHSGHYDKLAEWLFDETWNVAGSGEHVKFNDWSVPKDDPIHNAPSDVALGMAISSLIVNSHVIVIPTGMYANYSDWINKEIAAARQYSIPILAVDLWASQRTSSVVQDNATQTVGWQKKSVAEGVFGLVT